MNKTVKTRPSAATLERATDTGISAGRAAMQVGAQGDCTIPSAGLQGRLALRPREVAEVLGIGQNRAYELCTRSDFPAVRLGENTVIVPVAALKRWLCERAEQGGGASDAD